MSLLWVSVLWLPCGLYKLFHRLLCCVCAHLLSCVWLCDPTDGPLSMEFSRQEYWSGLPFSHFRGSSQARGWTCVSCISCTGRQILYHFATWETHFIGYIVLFLLKSCHLHLLMQILSFYSSLLVLSPQIIPFCVLSLPNWSSYFFKMLLSPFDLYVLIA